MRHCEAGGAARWWVIVPLKDSRAAKSRLGGRAGDRSRTAAAMARDTLRAIAGAPGVRRTLVVVQRAEDASVLALPGSLLVVHPAPGLNDAVLGGASRARREEPGCHLAVLPGDLPYLRAVELQDALDAAQHHERAFVADHDGGGTTLLTARGDTQLLPSYGSGSARAHQASGAVLLDLPPHSGLRRDVDVPRDLVLGRGLGRETRDALTALRGPRPGER